MRIISTVRFWFTVCLIVLLNGSLLHAENWPEWRGPTRDGVSREVSLPSHWDAGKNIAWKLDLPGMGSSTPAVWGKQIFLTSQAGSDLVLMCIGTEGKEVWRRKLGEGQHRYMGGEGNDASASPCTDGVHVFALVGSGDLGCFDLSGKEIWKLNLQERYGEFELQFGMHVTPVLFKDHLYISLIHSGAALVIALDKATGREVWKVERESDGRAECEHSYASPVLWQRDQDAYLVVHGNDYATAHSLSNGAEIWRLGDLNPKKRYNPTLRFVASPVATRDLIVVPTAKNGPVVGVKPEARGAIQTGNAFEQWRRPQNTPDVPSPLVSDGLVYLCREFGHLICMDAASGKEHYMQRPHNTRHRGSPVYADGKVYLTARDGIVSVVKAGTKYELLAKNKLPDDINASPAISDGRIYLRGFKALYAISEGGK